MNKALIWLIMVGCMAATTIATAAEFEARLAPFQTVPRPADGETVSANPPCFVYPAATNYSAYVIEFSRDAKFSEGTTRRLSSPYMLAVAPEPLKPGRYFWRWRPGKLDDGATLWSAVRAFTVTKDAPVVPFPEVGALVKRLGTSRPRVMVRADEVADLRQRALAKFGKSWLYQVHKTAEQMRDKPLLPEPAFLPPSGDPNRIALYLKTFQTTRPFFGEMSRLAENYLLTGDELSGQEAKRRLLHIIAWEPRGSTRLSHNDEVGTDVVRHCPVVFDRVYPLLNASEKRHGLDCLTVRMQEMRDRWRARPFEKFPYESHNMGYFLPDLLQASLALAGEAPVEEMLRYTLLQLWSPFYPPFGGDDGGWSQGPGYWSWIAAVCAQTYQLVERATDVPVRLRSSLRKQSLYKLYGNPPCSPMSPFGDGHEGRAGGGQTMALLAALYNDPYAKWYAEQQKTGSSGLAALLFNSDRVTAKSPAELPQGHAFFDIGLAAMHTALADATNNVSLFFRSSPFGSTSHAYADQNTFALHAYGEALIIASGYYQAYGCPHHRQWTSKTIASNSVLVNGEGQTEHDWNAKGRLAVFLTTPAGDYAVGDAAQAYTGKLDRFDRRIVFLRPEHTGGLPIIVIRDELRAPKPATFQFLLHALSKMNVDAAAQRVAIAQGAARCRVDYLAPRGLRFDQHDRFTQPPFKPSPNQWHLTASTVEPAQETASLIVIQPYREAESNLLLTARLETGDGCVGVVLTGRDRVVTVVFRTDPAARSVRLGGIATDGNAASVTLLGETVHSALMFGGSSLTRGTKVLIKSAIPTRTGAAMKAKGSVPQIDICPLAGYCSRLGEKTAH
ncbi:MAG: DUF4962 domain-containing protein [Verrucomicrobiia bacterium]|jgi:hypothetical protein